MHRFWRFGHALDRRDPGAAVPAAIAPAVVAGELTALDLLRQELGAKAPAGWQLHVSRREGAMVAFITPPYQQAFDLWYEPDELRAAMQSFCPAKDSRSGERCAAGKLG